MNRLNEEVLPLPTREKISKPTINDVALACGVSKATVSYVINGKRVLKSDTRDRVFRAMREMNYHPSAVAQGLSRKKVHTLGVLFGVIDPVAFLSDPYAAGVLGGIVAQCQREKFNLTLFTDIWKNCDLSAAPLSDGRTDGILVMAPQMDSGVLEALSVLGIPIVAVSAQFQKGVAMVDVDNFAGAQMAATHLIELGHRRIAYLSGNEDLASFEPRRAGFRAAFEARGIEVVPELVKTSHFDGSLAFEQTKALLKLPQPPTAIWAGNDTIAFSVLEAARDLGVRVPEQLSVIGFDDIPTAARVTPALTTIRQPLQKIGEMATRLLIERIAEPTQIQSDEPHLLAPELVVRESTAPVR